MAIAYANLNPILARWLPGAAEASSVDCQACTRPYKCCAFQPFVANFLLGAILEKQGALPFSENFHLQPLGLVPTSEYRRRHAATVEEARGADLSCAFYDAHRGSCGIWAYRPGECSTYLCTPPSERRKRLSANTFRLETAVSQMALAELGFTPAEIGRQIDFLNHPEGGMILASQESLFSLYREAWAWAKTLPAEEVRCWDLETV